MVVAFCKVECWIVVLCAQLSCTSLKPQILTEQEQALTEEIGHDQESREVSMAISKLSENI